FGLNSLFNVFGLGTGVLGTMMAGASIVLQDHDDTAAALELIERERVTVYHGVPTNFVLALKELADGSYDLSSVRTGIVAGAPAPEELVMRIRRDLVPDLRMGYGLTETSETVALTRDDDPPGKKVATVGRPLPEVELRIHDVDGSVLPVESVGEIAVRGPCVM